MGYFVAICFILAGVSVDGVDAFCRWSEHFEPLSFARWQECYAITTEMQLIGFALLAFMLCSYKQVEFKVLTFFMVLWRVFVASLNLYGGDVGYSPLFVALLSAVYLTWFFKSLSIDKMQQDEEQPGAYVFYMPIHSFWGLLKAIINPWKGARYESVVVVNNRMVWAVNGREFVTRHIDDTDLAGKEGVKKYIGRNLTDVEISKLIHMVGKRAVPGLRDCRKLIRGIK